MTLASSLSFPANLEELPRVLLWIRQRLLKGKRPSRWDQQFELAVEEALVNIIRYAYPQGTGLIEIRFTLLSGTVELVILDRGVPFNPLTDVAPPDLQSPVEERKEGGLGVFLIRQLIDEVRYERDDGANILTLVKHFSQTK